jgi:antitoxin VapB
MSGSIPSSIGEKDSRLAGFCASRSLDGVVLRRRSNMAWATDGADFHCDTSSTQGVATLLWTPKRKVVYTDVIEAPRLRAEEPLAGWEILQTPWQDPPMALPEGRFASDFPDDCLYELRAPLTAAEVERSRTLCRETAEVLERVMSQDCKPGMTEWHLGGAVAGWLRDRGILAHVCLVAADERVSRFRHPIPTSKKIEKLAMVAVCAQRHGLICTATRLVHFGPPSEDLKRRHAAVGAVNRALHDATTVGSRWSDCLGAGVKAYEDAGYPDEWQLHHQGGPMGYEARDFKATPTETRTVFPRQLVGWNPTVTGTKAEDTILTPATPLPKGGCENLTDTGKWPRAANGACEILVR